MKPNICLDFDGVFNNYKGYDGDNIGRPREGIREFLEELSQDYTIIVCSVRKFQSDSPIREAGQWYMLNKASYCYCYCYRYHY